MKFESKYDHGQEVWTICSRETRKLVRCITCESKGKVTIGGEEFICPKCKGEARHPQYAGSKWYVDGHGIVGKIDVESYSYGFINDGCGRRERHVTYMLDTTGVGSGSIHEESRIYPSSAEAQAECDRRNASTDWTDEEVA